MAEVISVRDLRKTYYSGFFRRPVRALDGVSFSVEEGEIFGFIGPNGAGKTTAIKLVMGMIRPGGGEVRLMGKKPSDPESRREVGFLPEMPYFYDHLTGRELLGYYAVLSGVPGRGIGERVMEAAGRAGMKDHWLALRLRGYSKGMLQKLGLAQALLARPRLLVLDEPMSGLDPIGRREVRELLLALKAEGRTVFYSSHVLSDVEAICDRVAMVVDGAIRKSGTLEELLQGERRHYTVMVAGNPPEMPAGLPGKMEGNRFVGDTPEARHEFLRLAIDRGCEVLGVEEQRPSLEEVFAREAGRRGA